MSNAAIAVERPDPHWRAHAACRNGPTSLFYASDFEVQEQIAQEYCHHCPVRLDCFVTAWVNHEEDGVWGGIPEGDKAGGRKWLRKQLARRLRADQREDADVVRDVLANYLITRDAEIGATSAQRPKRAALIASLPPRRSVASAPVSEPSEDPSS